MSFGRLIEKIRETDNPTVAGLDPKLDYIPDFITEKHQACNSFEGAAEAIYEFNCGLIDALCGIVPAVKPQAAYYEMYGWQGVRALKYTIDYAKSKGMFVITDGKRNDIGSTMDAYAAGHLGVTDTLGEAFGSDALTVNGYLGTDGVKPLLGICDTYDKGIFVLCKTSNPSSGELQDREIDGKPIYEVMGGFCEEWGSKTLNKYGYSAVGAVIGATYPEQLSDLRKKLPHTFFLVPGYGVQGGAASQLKGAFDHYGMGAVVSSSRAIMCAWQKEGCSPEDYAQAAYREALKMKNEINQVRKNV